MENELIQIKVDANRKEPVLVGNALIALTDQSTSVYETRQIDDFLAYCAEVGAKHIFYLPERMTAFKTLKPSYSEDEASAVCSITKTPILKYLIEQNGEKMNLDEFEEYLRTVRRYLKGDSAVKLLDILNNVQISKVKTVSRQKDHAGNFSYQFSSEKGKDDIEFPKQVSLFVPIIMGSKQAHEIALDFFFTWSEDNGVPELKFQLRDIELSEKVEEALISEARAMLAASGLWSKFGSYKVIRRTDESGYQKEHHGYQSVGEKQRRKSNEKSEM